MKKIKNYIFDLIGINSIIEFHKDLINNSTTTSHRRYLSIVFAYNAIIIAYIGVITDASIGEILIALLSTSLLFAGLTTLSANAAIKAKSDVASEVVKNDADSDVSDAAKEIVQGDKPA